jgi:hypothetical protein
MPVSLAPATFSSGTRASGTPTCGALTTGPALPEKARIKKGSAATARAIRSSGASALNQGLVW